MSQAYHCLPTDLWIFDPTTPKGFYFNRGVFYFGRKIENDMSAAENRSRKHRKPGPGTDKLAYGARLAALERNLGTPVKRHRDPNPSEISHPFAKDDGEVKKDETVVVVSGF
jgi:hypothetical protein